MTTETRTATVCLSRTLSGQHVTHEAHIEAEGRYVRAGRNAFGKPAFRWVPTRFRAVHDSKFGAARNTVSSPWFGTKAEAEAWLTTTRDLDIDCTGPLRAA